MWVLELSYFAQGRLSMLKRRSKRCVCKSCGKPLQLKKLTFSKFEDERVEIFCNQCDKIEFGVEPEIYACARYFVETLEFNYYSGLDITESTKRMNIAKVCEIMSWENKHMGILNQDGFAVPITINENIMGKCIILSDDDIAEMPNITVGVVDLGRTDA